MKIWANTVVHNEENFIWFAIMSVVDYVDKVLVYDTGSTDQTVSIINGIKRIKKDKIIFKELGEVNAEEFPKIRQQMLDESNCDWMLVLDGDEIWWDSSIKNLIKKINTDGNDIDGIVVPMIVPVGDIYHLQAEEAGKYELLGKRGHFNLRAINKKIPGLHADFPYGRESYLDQDNKLVQERNNIIFVNAPYLHVTHLKRSAKKRKYNKYKYELGKKVNKGFLYPEILFNNYPSIIRSPWRRISLLDVILAGLLTPFRKLKRRI